MTGFKQQATGFNIAAPRTVRSTPVVRNMFIFGTVAASQSTNIVVAEDSYLEQVVFTGNAGWTTDNAQYVLQLGYSSTQDSIVGNDRPIISTALGYMRQSATLTSTVGDFHKLHPFPTPIFIPRNTALYFSSVTVTNFGFSFWCFLHFR